MAKSIESLYIEHLKFPDAGKYLIPDGRWEAWHGIKNHKEFIENCVPKLHLKETAPEHVKDAFEIVNYIHAFAYYKYEFFDIAYGKALQIMEMAFKLKYREITGKQWDIKEKKLKKLIEFLYGANLFDTHILQINALRESRNRELHPEFNSFSGNTFSRRIHHVLQVVNELYEDIPLRLERKRLLVELEKFIKENSDHGIEICKNSKNHSLHHLIIQIIDNKIPEPIYHLVAVPLFSLTRYQNKNFNGTVPRIIPLSLIGVKMEAGALSGFDLVSQTEVSFRKIQNHNSYIKHREWKSDFNKIQGNQIIDNSWLFNVGVLYFEKMYSFTNR
jgi:hypothetical protein